jgi:hypothetical protein
MTSTSPATSPSLSLSNSPTSQRGCWPAERSPSLEPKNPMTPFVLMPTTCSKYHRCRQAGLPADALAAMVERFIGFARSVDEGYHRGESAYARHHGDPTNKPNPSLGDQRCAVLQGKMVPGDLGQGRNPHRQERPHAARRRFGDPRPLCLRQCQRARDGHTFPSAGQRSGQGLEADAATK